MSAKQRALPVVLTVFSGVSLYCGAVVAVGLFEHTNPLFVGWLRVATSAVLLLILARPRREDFVGTPGKSAAIYGLATIGMNMVFYGAIAHIPMGTTVAIEFLGPVVVAALGSRGVRDFLALLLALLGVLALSGAQWDTSPVGVSFALLAAALWGAYIVFGSRVATVRPFQGIAVGFCYAAMLTLPVALYLAPHSMEISVGRFVALAFVMGTLSALIPYGVDLFTMKLAGPSYFALLTALLPLVAAVIGFALLGQTLTPWELVGMFAVVSAVVIRRP